MQGKRQKGKGCGSARVNMQVRLWLQRGCDFDQAESELLEKRKITSNRLARNEEQNLNF
jgi:hypothetical protein